MANVKVINFEELSSNDLAGLELACVKPVGVNGFGIYGTRTKDVAEKMSKNATQMAERLGCTTVVISASGADECNLMCGFPPDALQGFGVATLNFYRKK